MPERPRQHTRKASKALQVRGAKKRKNTRQYATNSSTWLRIRKSVLDSEPLCRECNKQGRYTAANEVDHIDGDSWNNEASNLQPLCKSCHSTKTATEQGTGGGSHLY